jgi:peptide/nickel transport system permease protein
VSISILVANMGGYVDDLRRGTIREGVALTIAMDPETRVLSRVERDRLINDLIAVEEQRLGLDRPFILRSFDFLQDAMTLNLGRSETMTSDSGSRFVRNIILERLAPTLLLMATSNLVLFFGSLFFALTLSRQYGSIIDRAVIALAPTSAAPSWFYGIFHDPILCRHMGVLPFGGMVDAPPPEDPLAYGLSVLRHMTLPASAIVISAIFISIYNWRTFFLIYSSEDYVEMAKAKGLSSRQIERRYILRPTLPTIIANFALTMIVCGPAQSSWKQFSTGRVWVGLLFSAISVFDTPVIVGSVVIYAYLLAITVFLLDFLYALVDPRIKVGGGGPQG